MVNKSIIKIFMIAVVIFSVSFYRIAWCFQITEERVAIQTAKSRGEVTVNEGSRTFEGMYNGRDEQGCDVVTVRIQYFPEVGGGSETLNYRICKGRIMEQSESSATDYGIPDGIEDAAEDVARNAQRYGTARGEYQGFTITAKSVRDKDKCLVEVRIFRGGKMYGRKIINGCN